VTPDVLAHDGLIEDTKQPVKILGVGDARGSDPRHAYCSALDQLGAAARRSTSSWTGQRADRRAATGGQAPSVGAGIARAERVAAGGDAADRDPGKRAKPAADDADDEEPAAAKTEEDEPAGEASESETTA
jgi:hypothetical protein